MRTVIPMTTTKQRHQADTAAELAGELTTGFGDLQSLLANLDPDADAKVLPHLQAAWQALESAFEAAERLDQE